jgi:hypothetical protein
MTRAILNRLSVPNAVYDRESLSETYVGHLVLVWVVQNIVQHIHRCLRLDSNTGTHALVVDVLDELFRVRLLVACAFGGFGSGGIDGGFVVEAVQVASGFLEVLDPFLRLLEPVSRTFSISHASSLTVLSVPAIPYLSDHHVAVEGALSVGLGGLLHVWADLGNDRCSEGDVGNEVAVHDVHVQPVCSMADGV